MKITPVFVVSSTIDCLGYMADKIYIRFKTGATYSYDAVPEAMFWALQKAESVGSFFHHNIRKNPDIHYTKEPIDPFVAA